MEHDPNDQQSSAGRKIETISKSIGIVLTLALTGAIVGYLIDITFGSNNILSGFYGFIFGGIAGGVLGIMASSNMKDSA